jgi:hypothetical protein
LPEFIQHGGLRVLRLDYSGFLPAELTEAFGRAGELIAAQPVGSLRILTLLDSRFDADAAEAFKRYAIGNRPYVRASAVVAAGFWKVLLTSVKLHGRRDLALFDDPTAALEWLLRS